MTRETRKSSRGIAAAGPPRRADSRRPPSGPRTRRRQPHDWFAEQLLLVLSGRRPVHTLLGHARHGAYEQLSRLAPQSPLRPPLGQRGATPVLRGVGACHPSPDAIEAFARIAAAGRTRALAFRLEREGDGRWLCSAIELDTTP